MSGSPRRCSSTEISSREAHGRAAASVPPRFPSRKTLEEFDFTFQTLDQEAGDRASRPARLPARQRERRAARAARDRQDAPRDRAWASAPASPGSASSSRQRTEWVALLADAQRQGRPRATSSNASNGSRS